MTCKYADWTRGQIEALMNILGGEQVCRKILARKVRVVIEEITEPILELVTTVHVAHHDRFVVADHFKVDVSDSAVVKIGLIGVNFKKHFLGKIEDVDAECKLRVSKLLKDFLDDKEILDELGAKAETTLARLWQLLLKQGRGDKKGALRTNDCANVFYVCDADGRLWAIRARWDSGFGFWDIEAYSVEDDGWRADSQVVSRDSVL